MATPRPCPSFAHLAAELQVKILLNLKLGDLTRCTRVCKALRGLIASEAAIQYKMELDRAGMVDGSSDAPLMVKLKKLRARNAAWETGFPLHTIMLQAPRHFGTYVCAGGFFLYEDSDRDGGDAGDKLAWRVHRPAWPELETSGGLDEMSRLLTGWRECFPELELTHVGACAVNPEEDMAVLMKTEIDHWVSQCIVLSLSHDRTPHPLAARPVFPAPISPWVDSMVSVGDLLAWSSTGGRHSESNSSGGELRVINWKTGATVWKCVPRTWGKCLLLDQSHVLVVNHRGVFVYQFDPNTPPTAPPFLANDDEYLLHLALPKLGKKAQVTNLRCYDYGPRYLSSDRPLFRESPDLNVVALYIGTSTHNVLLTHLVLIIPIATIRTRLETLQHVHPEERQSSRCVQWDQWGPDGARLFKLGGEPHIITVMGSRVAIPLRHRAIRVNAQDIYIVDVRPKSEEENFDCGERDVSSALGAPVGGIDASDTIRGLECFEEPVTTRLPYRMTYVKAWSDADSKLVEGQGLTHDGMVIACSPLNKTMREVFPVLAWIGNDARGFPSRIRYVRESPSKIREVR